MDIWANFANFFRHLWIFRRIDVITSGGNDILVMWPSTLGVTENIAQTENWLINLAEIIWIPHSNCNVQGTSNDRYGQVISPKLAFEIGLWKSKLGVLRGDIWVILISVVASPWRWLSLICSNLIKYSQQIVGPNLRFIGFLAYSISFDTARTPTQPLCSNCQLLCSS